MCGLAKGTGPVYVGFAVQGVGCTILGSETRRWVAVERGGEGAHTGRQVRGQGAPRHHPESPQHPGLRRQGETHVSCRALALGLPK